MGFSDSYPYFRKHDLQQAGPSRSPPVELVECETYNEVAVVFVFYKAEEFTGKGHSGTSCID